MNVTPVSTLTLLKHMPAFLLLNGLYKTETLPLTQHGKGTWIKPISTIYTSED